MPEKLESWLEAVDRISPAKDDGICMLDVLMKI